MAGSSSTSPQEKRLSIVGFITMSFAVIVTSLLLSILVEWIGMNFWWEEEGSLHSLKMVSTEIEYINKDFREENILGYSPMDFVDYAYSTFYDSEDDDGMLENAMAWTIESNSPDSTMLATAVRTGGEVFKEYSLAALYITIIFTIRLSILILSLPLFILVTVIAVIDGFAQRDIRRWTNGRESGFRYHVMKSLALPMFFLAWIIYLSIPFSIHPNFIVLPLALLYGFIVREGISWFKKYL